MIQWIETVGPPSSGERQRNGDQPASPSRRGRTEYCHASNPSEGAKRRQRDNEEPKEE